MGRTEASMLSPLMVDGAESDGCLWAVIGPGSGQDL